MNKDQEQQKDLGWLNFLMLCVGGFLLVKLFGVIEALVGIGLFSYLKPHGRVVAAVGAFVAMFTLSLIFSVYMRTKVGI